MNNIKINPIQEKLTENDIALVKKNIRLITWLGHIAKILCAIILISIPFNGLSTGTIAAAAIMAGMAWLFKRGAEVETKAMALGFKYVASFQCKSKWAKNGMGRKGTSTYYFIKVDESEDTPLRIKQTMSKKSPNGLYDNIQENDILIVHSLSPNLVGWIDAEIKKP